MDSVSLDPPFYHGSSPSVGKLSLSLFSGRLSCFLLTITQPILRWSTLGFLKGAIQIQGIIFYIIIIIIPSFFRFCFIFLSKSKMNCSNLTGIWQIFTRLLVCLFFTIIFESSLCHSCCTKHLTVCDIVLRRFRLSRETEQNVTGWLFTTHETHIVKPLMCSCLPLRQCRL